MPSDPLYLIAVLAVLVGLSEWLVRRTFLRYLGTALLVIVLTAVVANAGLIPTGTGGVAVYDGVFAYLAPLAIFWLLLGVDLRKVLDAGGLMLGAFLVGALGSGLGAVVGIWAVDGAESIGPRFGALAGMFAGTYTGGSINFNAVALHYGVMEEGVLFAGATAVDSIITTFWMVVTILLPRCLPKGVRGRPENELKEADAELSAGLNDTETVDPIDLAFVLAIGAAGVWVSGELAVATSELLPFGVNKTLVLTTIALVLAQTPLAQRLRGARLLGMFTVYIFLAVIGAYCDVHELARLGELGVTLAIFATIVVMVHGTVIFGVGALFRVDPAVTAVASQANVGGGTTALALARSLGRPDLVLPAILVGSLGSGIGNFLGFFVAGWLQP